MPACLMIYSALFTATIEVNASYLPHFAALIHTAIINGFKLSPIEAWAHNHELSHTGGT